MRFPFLLAAGFLTLGTVAATAAELSADDQKFLAAYVQVHDALAADKLADANKAASALPDQSGADLAKAASIEAARKAFAVLTPRAEILAAGQPAYHIFYCPMAKKDWVQTGTSIANPYYGAEMLTCGVEKKK